VVPIIVTTHDIIFKIIDLVQLNIGGDFTMYFSNFTRQNYDLTI